VYTKKQMGDAGEMLVAAELTLHGVPAFIVPSNWPGYDVVAQPPKEGIQRVSVKTRTFAKSGNFVGFGNEDKLDWLAIVILPGLSSDARRIFIAPCEVVLRLSYEAKHRESRGFFVNRLMEMPPDPLPDEPVPTGGWGLGDYENNFGLALVTA
jgi:hypothetical protein